ncbi:hypothetical protein A3860_25160 [Niastella vici]|uniref:Uncharacterized protein n=2 Tax=Niastella vici TaxID=1703345 RepID=A0A1V9FXX1_9BACT|nr:hypothetical protein A3860_25160 [Niastella vici]
MHCACAQSVRKTRTITTSISKNGTTSGDTTFFTYPNGTLLRFFNRNLRAAFAEGTGELELGSCNLYIMIDTAGKVTKTWCDSVTNKTVEKEVLRVAGKLATMKPTTIKGKPVFTIVMATVNMEHENEKESYRKADILVIVWDPVYKKSTGR